MRQALAFFPGRNGKAGGQGPAPCSLRRTPPQRVPSVLLDPLPAVPTPEVLMLNSPPLCTRPFSKEIRKDTHGSRPRAMSTWKGPQACPVT